MSARGRAWRSGLGMMAAVLFAGPCAAARPENGVFNVRDFGAKGDGRTVDTPAINKAIDAASAFGGGTVRIPGGTYLCATIRLKSHVGLYLDHGATIEAASEKVAAFDDPEPNEWSDKYQDFGHSHWRNSMIWGDGLEDVAIEGPGLINGKGLTRSSPRGGAGLPKGVGNKAIGLKNCHHVTIRDVSILHGGHFAILATGVDDLTIDNVKIDTFRDGMDIDACRNVRISNCHVNSPWDDGICLKSSFALGKARDTANVLITNSMVTGYDEGSYLDGTYERGIRAQHQNIPTGRIKLGTESSGGFKNITISNCVFEFSRGLALEAVDGGSIEDVSISNITMRDIVNAPIFIRIGNRLRSPAGTPMGVARRIHIDNVVASNVSSDHGILISGIPGHPIEDLRLTNIRVQYKGGGTREEAAREVPEMENAYPEPRSFGRIPSWGAFIRHVTGLAVRGMDLAHDGDEQRPVVILDDVVGADLDHVSAPVTAGVEPLVLKNVRDLVVHDSLGIAEKRVAGAPAADSEESPKTVRVKLFDGKTLTGWKKYGGEGTFEVKDGAIVGTWVLGDESAYLVHDLQLEDFELSCEFKPDPGLNSGIQFRSVVNPEIKGKVQGYQYEIDPTDRALTGGVYDQSLPRGWLVPKNEPEAREAWKAKGSKLKIGEWNQMRVECRGSKIRTWLNGELMAELEDTENVRGVIAFQVHHTRDAKLAGKTVAWRNVWIRSLD
jgi:polygalacturonase